MAINAEWGQRLRDAKSDWERAHDHRRLTYSAIGEAVARLVGRAEPFSHTAVAAWFKKGQEPDSFAVAQAIEQVLEQPPGALIVGHAVSVGRLADLTNPALARRIPDDELDRADAEAHAIRHPTTGRTRRSK